MESEWSTPHSFGIGAAYEIVPKRLLVATDLRYALLDDAVNDLNMTIEMEGAPAPIQSAMALQWKDSLVWAAAREYRVARLDAAARGLRLDHLGHRRRPRDGADACAWPAPFVARGRRNCAQRTPVRPRRAPTALAAQR